MKSYYRTLALLDKVTAKNNLFFAGFVGRALPDVYFVAGVRQREPQDSRKRISGGRGGNP
jgi:hypothetical protein